MEFNDFLCAHDKLVIQNTLNLSLYPKYNRMSYGKTNRYVISKDPQVLGSE